MEGRRRSQEQPYGEFSREATRGLRALSGTHPDPMLLAYHEAARYNPYQPLLYQQAWEAGIAAVPLQRSERLDELQALVAAGIPGVLHLHWTTRVLAHLDSAKAAARAREAFVGQLDAFLAAGGRLVWTIHNVVAHDARFEREELALQQAILERASVVHVLTARTAQHVAPFFAIPPEKVVHVPHPSYQGVYPDYRSRAQARHDLGLLPDELVFLVLGLLRPYKGLTALMDAWERLDPARPRRLVIAGDPMAETGMAELIERAALHPTMLIHPRFIPDDELQSFLRAADVAVLPYTRSLNSGALMLALTFGLPVIVPAGSPLGDEVDEAFARTFDPGDPDDLGRVLAGAETLATPGARAAASAAAAARPPAELSRRFATALREQLARA